MTTAKPGRSHPDGQPSITIYRCPQHLEFWSVCVDDPDGIGVRVLGEKCCPSQYRRQMSWRLTQARRDELVNAMDNALDDAE